MILKSTTADDFAVTLAVSGCFGRCYYLATMLRYLGNTLGELVAGINKLGFEATDIEGIAVEYLSSVLREADPIVALIDPYG